MTVPTAVPDAVAIVERGSAPVEGLPFFTVIVTYDTAHCTGCTWHRVLQATWSGAAARAVFDEVFAREDVKAIRSIRVGDAPPGA